MSPNLTELKMKDALAELTAITNEDDLIGLVEELLDNQQNTSYKPPTYKELFSTPGTEHMDVYGRIIPNSITNVANAEVNLAILKGPAARIRVNKKRIVDALRMLHNINNEIRQRVTKQAAQLVRKFPQGSKTESQYNQTQQIEGIQPFAAGEPNNKLTFGTSTRIAVGIKLPPIAQQLGNILSNFDGTIPTDGSQDKAFVHLLSQVNAAVLDHSGAFATLLVGILGHSRIERSLKQNLIFNHRGVFYRLTGTQSAGKKPVYGNVQELDPGADIKALTQLDDYLGMNQGIIVGTLHYEFRTNRGAIPEIVDLLTLLNELPVYRGVFSTDEEYEDLLDELIVEVDTSEEISDEVITLIAAPELEQPNVDVAVDVSIPEGLSEPVLEVADLDVTNEEDALALLEAANTNTPQSVDQSATPKGVQPMYDPNDDLWATFGNAQ